jgi:phosphoserine aminotransferase
VAFLAEAPSQRSNTSVCLKVIDPRVTALPAADQEKLAKRLAILLEAEGVALDVGHYRDAPPGLRIWCGATVETSDLETLTPWLDWAFAQALSELTPA